jgi:hypothetical protein
MSVRSFGEAQQGNVSTVMPLRHQRHATTAGCVVAATPEPEPAQLYDLTALAFRLHKLALHGWCVACGQDWPCPQVRLAYRIREGF